MRASSLSGKTIRKMILFTLFLVAVLLLLTAYFSCGVRFGDLGPRGGEYHYITSYM